MMKHLRKLALFMAMSGMFFTACQEKTELEKEIDQLHALKSSHLDNWIFDDANNYFYTVDNAQIDPCGDVKIRPFYEAAQVSIFNDDEYLYIKVDAEADWYIHYLSLNVWNEESDQINSSYSGFPYQKRFNDNMPAMLTFKIPYDARWLSCMKLNIKIYTKKIIDDQVVQSRYWWVKEVDGSIYPGYCWQDCDECPPVEVGEIVAGQHTEVGQLIVWEDVDNIYVKYALNDGWLLGETHLFVGCAENIPGKIKKGGIIPTPGHFPYQEMHDGLSTYTYVYPKSEIEKCNPNACLDIAAHAVVYKMDGEEVVEETAWSTGEEFGGPRWGWYSTYCPCE